VRELWESVHVILRVPGVGAEDIAGIELEVGNWELGFLHRKRTMRFTVPTSMASKISRASSL